MRALLTLVLLVCHGAVSADTLRQELLKSFAGEQNGVFTQERQVKGLPIALVSKGKFNYDAGKGLEWRTLHPVSSELNISRDGLRQQGKLLAGSEVIAQALLGVFSGDFTELETFFSLSLEGNIEQWRVNMMPKSQQVATIIQSIKLSGDSSSREITIRNANGDITRIDVTLTVNEGD
jgi:hypothetical protein